MSKIYVDEILPKENAQISAPNLQLPAGSVIQVVTGTASTVTSTESTTFVPTALAVSITPKYATSKILITVNGSVYHFTNAQSAVDVYRDGTSVTGQANGYEITWLNNTRGVMSASGQVIDEPNTTNTVEYKVYVRKRNGDYSVDFPTGVDGGMDVLITAMEIAG